MVFEEGERGPDIFISVPGKLARANMCDVGPVTPARRERSIGLLYHFLAFERCLTRLLSSSVGTDRGDYSRYVASTSCVKVCLGLLSPSLSALEASVVYL